MSPAADQRKREIREIFTRENLNSTFLLVGPDRSAKVNLALEISQGLVCERPKEPGQACQTCGSCLRISKQQSEALLVVRPEKNQIKIEQAREIVEFLNLRSVSLYRIVIVEETESLNPAAANSLLKILEEPPPKTLFFLVAPTPKHVLPTLRSRSMILTLPSEDPNPIQSLDLESRERVNETLKWWREDGQSYLRNAFKERVKDRHLAQTLALGFQAFFRDCFMNLHHLGDSPGISAASSGISEAWMDRAPELFELALHLEKELQGSRDSLLVFEEFWIRSHQIAGGPLSDRPSN